MVRLRDFGLDARPDVLGTHRIYAKKQDYEQGEKPANSRGYVDYESKVFRLSVRVNFGWFDVRLPAEES